jgi:HEPN domain-containing protein
MDRVQFWINSANDDWTVSRHLFEKEDYSYALFFGHLTLEKLLKGLYVYLRNETPPHTHRLVFLAESLSLEMNSPQVDLLEAVTDFNLEARYPDEKFSFKRKCTKEFAEKYLKEIEEMKEWLIKRLRS